MATITESKTVTTEEEYETPVYVKKTGDMFFKVYDVAGVIRMVTVHAAAPFWVTDGGFPNAQITSISEATASDETEYETARDLAIAGLEAI